MSTLEGAFNLDTLRKCEQHRDQRAVHIFRWSSDDVAVPVEETKSRNCLNGHHLDTFHARQQGIEGITFSNEHTSTRTNGERAAAKYVLELSRPRDGSINHQHKQARW